MKLEIKRMEKSRRDVMLELKWGNLAGSFISLIDKKFLLLPRNPSHYPINDSWYSKITISVQSSPTHLILLEKHSRPSQSSHPKELYKGTKRT